MLIEGEIKVWNNVKIAARAQDHADADEAQDQRAGVREWAPRGWGIWSPVSRLCGAGGASSRARFFISGVNREQKRRSNLLLFNYLEKRARRDTRGAYTFLPVPVPVPVPACNTRGTWRRNHARAHDQVAQSQRVVVQKRCAEQRENADEHAARVDGG